MHPSPGYLTAACLIALTACNASLRAQATPSLTPGTRVRVSAPALNLPEQEEGRILALQNDTMVVWLEGLADTVRLPLAQLATVDVSRGQHPAVRKGVAFGLVLGGLLGALVGAVTYQEPVVRCGFLGGPPGCTDDFFGRGGAVLGGGALGALAGMVVGGVIGAVHGSERWEPVHLGSRQSRVGLSLRPPSGPRSAPTLSLLVRF
jgi:uncharacterized protein YcfJ